MATPPDRLRRPHAARRAQRRMRGTCRRYALTVGSPSSQNRHGRSCAPVTPTRGPARPPPPAAPARPAAAAGPGRRRAGTRRTPRGRCRARRRAGPGPRARSTSRRTAGRRSRAVASPSTTSPARSSTAEASPSTPGDHVHAPVHAVGEVDVGVPGRAEHHRVARGAAPVGVRGRVAGRAGVRLDLGDPDGDPAGVQPAAQQPARGRQQRAGEQVRQRRQVGVAGAVTGRQVHVPTVPIPPPRGARGRASPRSTSTFC